MSVRRKLSITAGAMVLSLSGIVGGVITATSAQAQGSALLETANPSFDTQLCVAQDGGNLLVKSTVCSDGNASQWTDFDGDLIVNVATGDCLTVDGTDSGVYPAACTGNHAQLWTPYYETGSTGDFYEFVNGHTGYYLAAADNSLYQTPDKGYQDRWMNG
jgi:hypothetical protein